MNLTRRSMFAGLAATIAAPAIIRTPGLLMPIKPSLAPFDGPMTATEVLALRARLYDRLVNPPGFWDEDGVLNFAPKVSDWINVKAAAIRAQSLGI